MKTAVAVVVSLLLLQAGPANAGTEVIKAASQAARKALQITSRLTPAASSTAFRNRFNGEERSGGGRDRYDQGSCHSDSTFNSRRFVGITASIAGLAPLISSSNQQLDNQEHALEESIRVLNSVDINSNPAQVFQSLLILAKASPTSEKAHALLFHLAKDEIFKKVLVNLLTANPGELAFQVMEIPALRFSPAERSELLRSALRSLDSKPTLDAGLAQWIQRSWLTSPDFKNALMTFLESSHSSGSNLFQPGQLNIESVGFSELEKRHLVETRAQILATKVQRGEITRGFAKASEEVNLFHDRALENVVRDALQASIQHNLKNRFKAVKESPALTVHEFQEIETAADDLNWVGHTPELDQELGQLIEAKSDQMLKSIVSNEKFAEAYDPKRGIVHFSPNSWLQTDAFYETFGSNPHFRAKFLTALGRFELKNSPKSNPQFALNLDKFNFTEAEKQTITESRADHLGKVILSSENRSFQDHRQKISMIDLFNSNSEIQKSIRTRISNPIEQRLSQDLQIALSQPQAKSERLYEDFLNNIEWSKQNYDITPPFQDQPEKREELFNRLQKFPKLTFQAANLYRLLLRNPDYSKLVKLEESASAEKAAREYTDLVNTLNVYLANVMDRSDITDAAKRTQVSEALLRISNLKQELHRQDLKEVKKAIQQTSPLKIENIRRMTRLFANEESNAVPVLMQTTVGNGSAIRTEIEGALTQMYGQARNKELFIGRLISELKNRNQKIRFFAKHMIEKLSPNDIPPNVEKLMDVYTQQEKEDWKMSNPAQHDPNRFKYIVHGVDVPEFEKKSGKNQSWLDWFYFWFVSVGSGDGEEHYYSQNVFEAPEEFTQRKYICSSVIDDRHQTTYAPVGVIMKIKSPDQVAVDFEKGFSTNGLYMKKSEPHSVAYIMRSLDCSNQFVGETHIYGKNKYTGETSDIEAVFVQPSATAYQKATALAFAKQHNVPVITLNGKSKRMLSAIASRNLK